MSPRDLGVVLAGGRSRRMGRDKALLEIDGETFLARVARTLTQSTGGHVVVSVAGETSLHTEAAWLIIADAPDLHDHGPIAGVVSAMRWATKGAFDRIVTLPVDMPFVAAPAISYLLETARAASVAGTGGNPIPTFAVWPLSTLDTVEQLVGQDRVRALHQVQARLGAAYVSMDAFEPLQFVNVNTPEDFASASTKR
jgi:molybdopterin-guanine dinucleotide biosynthesis protein A